MKNPVPEDCGRVSVIPVLEVSGSADGASLGLKLRATFCPSAICSRDMLFPIPSIVSFAFLIALTRREQRPLVLST